MRIFPRLFLLAILAGCGGSKSSSNDLGTDLATGNDLAISSTNDLAGTDGATSACTQESDCPAIACLCAAASDPCGVSGSETDVQICSDGVCATDPASVCPSACSAFGGATWVNPTLPTAQTYGTSWSAIATPSTFDATSGVVGADDTFTTVVGSGYPQVAAIRSKIWSFASGTFTDITPSVLTTFPSNVDHQASFGLASGPSGSVYFSVRGTDTSFKTFGSVYQLTGATATQVAASFTAGAQDIAPLVYDSFLYIGGQASSSAPLVGVLTGSVAGKFPLPSPESADLSGIVSMTSSGTGSEWASDSSHILSLSMSGATDVPLPTTATNASVRQVAYANGALYASLTSSIEATLWKLAGSTWTSICSPDRDVRNIQTLNDGTLFATTSQAAYLFDGTTWSRLPSTAGVTYAHGSKASLYGFANSVSGAGAVYKLTP